MGDFPVPFSLAAANATMHPGHPACSTGGVTELAGIGFGAVAAPAANRAIYIPFMVDQYCTAKQMFWENGAAAGTTDVGIYDAGYTRLVSLTATANAGTIQIGNITDTPLEPGIYYMAWLPSTVTTQTYWSAAVSIPALRFCGVTQEAVGSATLGATGVPAAVASAYLPFVGISFQAVV